MELPTRHPRHVTHLVRWVALGLLTVVVAVFLVGAVGVYGFGWQGAKTATLTRVVKLPAVSIGFRPLWYNDYLAQLRALRQYNRTLSAETKGVFQAQSEADMIRTTLRKLVRDAATERLLHSYQVSFTSVDVDQAFSAQIEQSGDRTAALNSIDELYGWDGSEYERYVVRSAVAREKLRTYLSFTAPHNQAAERQAKRVLEFVESGAESFEDLARKYSDDAYGVDGGDIGFVTRGQLVDELDAAAFSQDINTVSGLIHTKYGYHIIKVLERKDVNGQEQAHLLQITINGPSVDEAISAWLKRQRVWIWIGGWRWDAKAADAVSA